MTNNTEKKNYFHKGKIYIDCGFEYPYLPYRQAGRWSEFHKKWTKLQNDLLTVTSYQYTGTDLKDGQAVVEGVDYELKYQIKRTVEKDGWLNRPHEVMHEYTQEWGWDKRIVAIPKEQPQHQEEKSFASNRNHCVKCDIYFDENVCPKCNGETQEELWEEVRECFGFGSNDELAYKELQEQFTIQRKQ